MTQETIDVVAHLHDEGRSPRTRLERFAQNFRNMGVVESVEAIAPDLKKGAGETRLDGDTLRVKTTPKGMDTTLVRDEAGFDFDVLNTHYDAEAHRIVHLLVLTDEMDTDLLSDDERSEIEESLYRTLVDCGPGVRDEELYNRLTDRLDEVSA